MEPLEPKLILVPTDFSDPAAHSLRYASSLAQRFGAHLLVIYADTFIPPVDFTASAAGTFGLSQDLMVEEAEKQLREHAMANIGNDVPFDLRVVVAGPIDAILDTVRQSGANLVVMGTHGRTGVRRLLFGSVTEAVMRISPVPVIAVNRTTAESAGVGKVLCPVTFTPASLAALRLAASLVDARKAPLVLLRAVDSVDGLDSAKELVRLRKWLPPELVDRCELKLHSAEATPEEIVELARTTHSDLIALGVPGGRRIEDSLRGTIAERVVRHSGCPVLTVSAFAAGVLPSPALVASEKDRELVVAR